MATVRTTIANYVGILIQVYVILIFVRVLISFLPQIPYYRVLDAILTFVRDVTDPYLNLFRRFLPLVRIGPGALDLSPLVGIVVLTIVGGIVTRLIGG
jgi:YggT family protein